MGKPRYFSPNLFRFLKGLKRHNDRDWFLAHKEQYEQEVREPSLRFITDFGAQLQRISPRFAAIPKPIGGSLFRIYRDTRFSADKRPYKTHVGIYFPHKQAGRDVHAPCFYLHLEPGGCFAAAGLWHPDALALRTVRDAIVQQSDGWRRVRQAGILSDGDRLVSTPRGYDPSHQFIEDLKRKDFVSDIPLSDSRICSPRFMGEYADACRRMTPLVKFLTEALRFPY